MTRAVISEVESSVSASRETSLPKSRIGGMQETGAQANAGLPMGSPNERRQSYLCRADELESEAAKRIGDVRAAYLCLAALWRDLAAADE